MMSDSAHSRGMRGGVLRLSYDHRRREMRDARVPHTVAHVRIGTDEQCFDEDATVQWDSISVQLLFDIVRVDTRFIVPGGVLNVDESAVGHDGHGGLSV